MQPYNEPPSYFGCRSGEHWLRYQKQQRKEMTVGLTVFTVTVLLLIGIVSLIVARWS